MTTLPADIQSLIAEEMQFGHYKDETDVLRRALQALQNEREALTADDDDGEVLASIQRGLREASEGKGKSIEEFDRDFRARHGLSDDL